MIKEMNEMKMSKIENIETIYVLQESPEQNPSTLQPIVFRNIGEIKNVREAGYSDGAGDVFYHSSEPIAVGRLHPIAQLKITRKTGMVVWRNTDTKFTDD